MRAGLWNSAPAAEMRRDLPQRNGYNLPMPKPSLMRPFALFALATLSACAADPAQDEAPPVQTLDVLACNGQPALCDRPYDQVTYLTTHNAMSHA
jgi:hypothetical protein